MIQKSEINPLERKKLVKTLLTRFSILPLFLGLLVLIPSGTFDFWQLYLYIAVLVLPMIYVMQYFLRNDPQFLVRRMRGKEKEKQQKMIQVLSSLVYFSGYILPGLDRRFGWSDVPVHVVVAADVVILLGYLLIFFVFKQNSFASRIVEVENNQTLISDGLYGIVRHPMYLGVILMFVPVPLALGSYWGLIPMAFIPLTLVFRVLNEEKVLHDGLEGYTEYCRRIRYRIIPFVW